MTDTKTPGDQTSVDKTSADKPLGVATPKTLTLKRGPEQSTVRQSFSHGRSNQVVVEVKRRIGAPAAVAPRDVAPRPPANPVPAPPPRPAVPVAATPAAPAAAPRPTSSMLLRTLSSDEQDARSRALADSRVREADQRQRAAEEATARAERDERERKEREAATARVQEEESRRRSEEDFKRRAEGEARRRVTGEEPAPRAPRVDIPRADGASYRALRAHQAQHRAALNHVMAVQARCVIQVPARQALIRRVRAPLAHARRAQVMQQPFRHQMRSFQHSAPRALSVFALPRLMMMMVH
jgi:hypothetical protein